MISREHVQAMVDHAREGYPNEACGILARQGDTIVHFYPMINADASPVHYRMEPQEQLRVMMDMDGREWELGAIYHSHTHTRAYPSPTDIRLAQYPDAVYIIVSLADEKNPEVRAFRIEQGTVVDEALEIRNEVGA